MSNYTVKSKATSHKTIRKFELNRFLVNQRTFTFNSRKEAETSLIASRLFDLVYVNTVYIAQNFIAVKINEDTSWADVNNEIARLITLFFDSDQPVVTPGARGQKVPITVYTESTPNSMALKFVCNTRLVINSIQFTDQESAANAPLPQALFKFSYVNRLFFDNNSITVTKTPRSDWFEISLELREFIRSYLQKGQPVLHEQHNIVEGTTLSPENYAALPHFSKTLIDTINSTIQPTVTKNGGKVKFSAYDQGKATVKVVLEGTYNHPPVAQNSIKNHLQQLLIQTYPEQVEHIEINRP